MQDIWIPEALITLFLFLNILRPFIKKLRAVDGLAWLPLLALVVTAALIPAYGFRPETFPLLVYAAILTVISIAKQAGDDSKFRDFRETKLILVLPPLVILAAAAWIAFFFTPSVYSSQAGYTQTAVNAGEKEYLIRVYTDKADRRPSLRPLILFLPPTLGSLATIDQVSAELSDRGFTVLACSSERPGISPAESFNYFRAFFSGTVSADANRRGRVLEDKRKEDLLFLLSWIRQNPRLEGNSRLFDIASRNAVFLAGHDAGGSALVLMGNSLPLTMGGIKIRGIIAIESYLWSIYREEAPEILPLPPDAGWFLSVRHGLGSWYQSAKPKRITGMAPIPELSIPLLLLVSDRSLEPKHADGRYSALLKIYKAARGPASLVSSDGAGPLHYSDFPVSYPIITALLSGSQKQVWNNNETPARTAEIIAAFAASAPDIIP